MKAYLIPGSGENLESRDYTAVLDMYKQVGYEPHFVSIDWKYKTINDWIAEVESKISNGDIQDSLLSGFSFGSMIALGLAGKINPKQLLLFSLSPYFKEDFPIAEKYAKWAGKRRTHDFKNFSMNDLAAQVNCPTKIFIGQKEIDKYPDMQGRSDQAHKKIKNSQHIIIKDVGHDVGDPNYVAAIKRMLQNT